MEKGADDARGQPGPGAARPRTRRLMLAILGMILCVVLAVGIVLQEGGRIVQVDRRGHLYSPILRQMMSKHHRASKPAEAPAAPPAG
jgi:hypothetical protein